MTLTPVDTFLIDSCVVSNRSPEEASGVEMVTDLRVRRSGIRFPTGTMGGGPEDLSIPPTIGLGV